MESGGEEQEFDGKKQVSDKNKKEPARKQHESQRKSAAPVPPRPKRWPRKAAIAATATAASAANATQKAKPRSKKEGEEKGKGKEEEEGESPKKKIPPPPPQILPLLPFMAKLGPGQGLGCEAAVGSLAPSWKREYKPCGKHTEGKRPLYAIGFNFMDARYYDVFATVGGNRVTTYRCLENGSFALLQAYVDEDKDESFYTLSWARDRVDGSPLLVAAGINGIIRVINCATEKLAKSFVGHGDSINEISVEAFTHHFCKQG